MASIQIIHVGDTPRPTRTTRIGRPTFAEAARARGIDLNREVKLWKRRDRYAVKHQPDRPKTFADASTTSLYSGYWKHDKCYTPDHASRDLATLRNPSSTADYVAAWTRLNNLTGVLS